MSAELNLLRGFELAARGTPIHLPLAAQRVLAFLALNDRPLRRVYVAGRLWLDATESRAYANLRSALWRINREDVELVETNAADVRLSPTVDVDVHRAVAASHGALDRPEAAESYLREDIGGDLLPDWYDSWVEEERDRLRQLRLHALEAVADRMLEAGRYGKAVEAGLVAVRSDPLRESAHRVLIKIYAAEGNASEALRQYGLYKRRLHDELGLDPSPQMEALVRDLLRLHARVDVTLTRA